MQQPFAVRYYVELDICRFESRLLHESEAGAEEAATAAARERAKGRRRREDDEKVAEKTAEWIRAAVGSERENSQRAKR